MRAGLVLAFVTVLSLGTLGGHAYIWHKLVVEPAWGAPWSALLTGLLGLLWVTIPATMVGLRFAPNHIRGPVAWVGYTWMGFGAYLLVFSLVADGAQALAGVAGAVSPAALASTDLARGVAVSVAVGSVLVGLAGLRRVARGFQVKRVPIALDKLAPGARYTIVQMTDVHVGPTIGRALVEQLVQAANALEPDAIVITGDLVDGTLAQVGDAVEPLRDLRARDGVFFVTGNHEYYWGADAWIARLTGLGVRVLRNERVRLRDTIELAGVDDWLAARMIPGHGQDVTKALAGRDPALPVVLLSHNPKAYEAAVAQGVDLQLSGHVHGGQMAPFNWLARLDQPLVAGLFRRGATWIYVSAGSGYWGPPMRVGTTAELTVVELSAL